MTAADRIDQILSEGAIGSTETARLLGSYRAGRPTHPSTVTRFMLKGVRLADGQRIFLEHIRISGRLMTSRPALLRFLSLQQPHEFPDEAEPRTPSQRRQADARAQAELRTLGIK